MLKELSEDLNSIKKIQLEMKDTLIETKNFRETVEWMKPRIKLMIWNIGSKKNNHAEENTKKRI